MDKRRGCDLTSSQVKPLFTRLNGAHAEDTTMTIQPPCPQGEPLLVNYSLTGSGQEREGGGNEGEVLKFSSEQISQSQQDPPPHPINQLNNKGTRLTWVTYFSRNALSFRAVCTCRTQRPGMCMSSGLFSVHENQFGTGFTCSHCPCSWEC